MLTAELLNIDHNAYLVDPARAGEIMDSWKKFGLVEKITVETQDFPATHRFMGRQDADTPVISLITPEAEDTVFSQVIDRHGPGLLYTAYAISPEADIDSLYDQMNAWGWKLLGPVFTYEDSRGPLQNAIAVAPGSPFSPFTLFLQRRKGHGDEVRHEIDVIILDSIFEHYDRYCQSAL